ncbi:MAG: bifunctional oligoribonuclease/PAP phosphatase NrnA [Bdellovibrionaceae bacterium]|nr:bifunctional oligoribonuclease/PAP phosphatase NrnA [Pseudobdellovibrionaceae bacterium]
MLKQIAAKIRAAESVVLSTHRHSDGDGLGAQVALFHALKKLGKSVRVLNVDETPKRYSFLQSTRIIQAFEGTHEKLKPTDLSLIFDTNDYRLVEPLYSELRRQCREIIFVDHHPVLKEGPLPTSGSLIDTSAASTGEMVYQLINELGIALDRDIARALYTSVVFDTQLFRYVRNSATSHLMAAELLRFESRPDEVHRRLFANYTHKKVAFIAKALGQIEYFAEGRIAVLRLRSQDLLDHELDLDESRDVVDMLMNIESLEAAALFREDGHNLYKLSLRSKNEFEVLAIAENVGGGGHPFSAGAYLNGPYEELKERVVSQLLRSVARPGDASKNESA